MTDQSSTEPGSESQTPAVSRWVVATAITGTVLIALGAFWLSFTALTDLAARAGIAVGQAWVWPLIVDGIIIVATISVVALSPYGRRATWYPWALLIVGAVVSVAGNAAHAGIAGSGSLSRPVAAAISAVPPLVLLSITHLTVELTRRTRRIPPVVGDHMTPEAAEGPNADVVPREERIRTAWARRDEGWSNKRIATDLGVHPSTVGRWFADENLVRTDHGDSSAGARPSPMSTAWTTETSDAN